MREVKILIDALGGEKRCSVESATPPNGIPINEFEFR